MPCCFPWRNLPSVLLRGHPLGKETSGGGRLLVDPVTGPEGESSSSYRHFISDPWLSHPTPFLESVEKRTGPGGQEGSEETIFEHFEAQHVLDFSYLSSSRSTPAEPPAPAICSCPERSRLEISRRCICVPSLESGSICSSCDLSVCPLAFDSGLIPE